MNKLRSLLLLPLGLLVACSVPDETERLAKQGLPPSGFVGSVEQGGAIYNQNCALCHGRRMQGSEQGPPLIHKVYEPGHHADLAFYSAVKNGVRQHHWHFGDMPAQPQVSPTDAAHIVAYVRSHQRRAGIR